jgi:hypothetical protein
MVITNGAGMTSIPRPVDAIPENREQVIALLNHVGFDEGQLTPDQKRAIRRLYNLDEYGGVARALEGGGRYEQQ